VTATPGRDHYILFAIASHVRNWSRMTAAVDFHSPNLFAGTGVERAKTAVVGSRDEHQPARGGDSAANVRRSRIVNALRLQLFGDSERHAPYDVSGVHVDGMQQAPRRFLARPELSVPKARVLSGRAGALIPDPRAFRLLRHPC